MGKKKATNNISARFVFDRKKTATKSSSPVPKKGLVQMELSQGGKRKFISAGVKIYADQWDDKKYVVNCANAVEHNRILSDKYTSVMREIANACENGEDLSKVVNKTRGEDTDFFDFAYAEVGKMNVSKSTENSYISTLRHAENSGEFGSLRNVKIQNIEKFDTYLRKLGLSGMSINLYHSKLCRLLTIAMKHELVDANPYALFKPRKAHTKLRRFLRENEIKEILEFSISDYERKNPTLERRAKYIDRARDLFVFQCYTGLAYADMLALNQKSIIKDKDGYYIRRKRVKTGETYVVVLLKPALAVLKKYKFKLPTQRYQTYLQELKTIGELLGFDFRLTSHIGRHSFATLALSKGIPIEIVSKMLGHTNIATTQIYAKVLAEDVKSAYRKLDGLIE